MREFENMCIIIKSTLQWYMKLGDGTVGESSEINTIAIVFPGQIYLEYLDLW